MFRDGTGTSTVYDHTFFATFRQTDRLSNLQVYSAYIGHFQGHGVPWYDRSWGHLFSSFEDFLTFGWPTVTLTDARTGKGHIVTRSGSVGAFSKMVKTRYVSSARFSYSEV